MTFAMFDRIVSQIFQNQSQNYWHFDSSTKVKIHFQKHQKSLVDSLNGSYKCNPNIHFELRFINLKIFALEISKMNAISVKFNRNHLKSSTFTRRKVVATLSSVL